MNETIQRNTALDSVVLVEVKKGSAGIRTAIGKARKGCFRHTRPDELAAFVIQKIVERSKIDPALIGDVILGCAFPEGVQGMQIARTAVIRAGLSLGAREWFVSIPARTLNRFCASGLQAIVDGVAQVATGMSNVVIAGGVESMSMVPMGGVDFSANPFLARTYPDYYTSMGLTAEALAELDGISREAQDAFALRSHQKALQHLDATRNEIEPFTVVEKMVEGETSYIAEVDEGPRADTTLEALAKLKPPFKQNGTVTAGNSSQMSDGAAAVLIMQQRQADACGLTPFARLRAYNVEGVAPELMGIGPVAAIPNALYMAELNISDIGIVELNEAFASQAISVLGRLKTEEGIEILDDRVNVNGGAIAFGHPLGCTGAYLTIKGLNEARRRNERYAMITMCVGGGMGACGIFELL